MPGKWIIQIFVGLLLLTFSGETVFAHGGHKKPTAEMEESAPETGSPYAIDGDDEASSTGEQGDLSLSRTDIFADEPPMAHEGMEHMDHQPAGTMDHKMPEVEIAKREWVSTKQKGYGAAVGITIFAGLIFGVLSIKRPLE